MYLADLAMACWLPCASPKSSTSRPRPPPSAGEGFFEVKEQSELLNVKAQDVSLCRHVDG